VRSGATIGLAIPQRFRGRERRKANLRSMIPL